MAWEDWFYWILGSFIFAYYMTFAFDLIVGRFLLGYLRDIDTQAFRSQWPSVAIIIPCRNEAGTVEEALKSVLAIDYPNKSIIVLNDRSTDNTLDVIAKVAKGHPELEVASIDDLPYGWLGKNHALFQGARHAKTDFLLFTDADVHFHPSALRRAMTYLEKNQLDHLAVNPTLVRKDWFYNAVLSGFTLFFNMRFRPWYAKFQDRSEYVGVSAFNLVKRSTYEAFGGHQSIALRPDVDMKFGELVKKNRFKQDMLLGADMVWLDWYASTWGLVKGLMKNTFAFLEYDVNKAAITTVGQIFIGIWPIMALFFLEGPLFWFYWAILILIALVFWENDKGSRLSPLGFVLYPVTCMIMSFIVATSAVRTLHDGGITWRETFYPLSMLMSKSTT